MELRGRLTGVGTCYRVTEQDREPGQEYAEGDLLLPTVIVQFNKLC